MNSKACEFRGYASPRLFDAFERPFNDDFTKLVGTIALESHGNFAAYKWHDSQTVLLLTDHALTLPIYYGIREQQIAVGWNAFDVANELGATADLTSISDFLLNGTVCYPYTLFERVFVAPPGSISILTEEGLKTDAYYVPSEVPEREDLQYWSDRLSKTVQSALEFGLQDCSSVKVLFSGGSDSRVVASMLPSNIHSELVTFAGSDNREVKLARRAASALGRGLVFIQRPNGRYFRNIGERVSLVSGLFDVAHTHFYGELGSYLKNSDAIVGAYMADTLFKAVWLDNVTPSKSLIPPRLRLPYPDEPVGIANAKSSLWLRKDCLDKVMARRLNHHERLRSFRPLSCGNWHNRWPLGTQQPHYAHYLACRSIGPKLVEPFLDCQSYRLAAELPDVFRPNNDVFRAAFRKPLGSAGWCLSSSGTLPSLGGMPGHLFGLATRGAWKARDMALRAIGVAVGEQGSWNAGSEYEGLKTNDFLTSSEVAVLLSALNQLSKVRFDNNKMLDIIQPAQAFRAIQLGKVLRG